MSLNVNLKFHQTLFVRPEDGAECLACTKFYNFYIMEWDEEQQCFWDEVDNDYSVDEIILWAYLPKEECKEFDKRTSIRIKK